MNKLHPLLWGSLLLLPACNSSGDDDDDNGGGGPGNPPANLDYPIDDVFYILGVPADVNDPTVDGVVDDYTITPSLPAGLQFDSDTGVISGTPTETAPLETFVVTAFNQDGSTTSEIRIGVAEPPQLALLLNESDDTVSLYTVEATSGKLQFNGYEQEPAGGAAAGKLAFHPSGMFAYQLTQAPGILVYTVDPSTGKLEPTSQASVGANPQEIAITPDGEFAYVAAFGADEVWAFSIDGSSGELSQLGTPQPVGQEPNTLALDPGGDFLWVGNSGDNSVSTLRIDGATGQLSDEGVLFAATGAPESMVVHPDGTDIYAIFEAFNFVAHFQVERADGSLTAGMTRAAGSDPSAIQVHPIGTWVYVTSRGDDALRVFPVNNDGSLQAAGAPVATGDQPVDLDLDSSGNYAWAVNNGSNDVFSYEINPQSGEPIPVGKVIARGNPTAFAVSKGPSAFDPQADFLYALNQTDQTINGFEVGNDGSLTEVGTPVLTENGPGGLATSPDGDFLYVANAVSHTVQVFEIDADTGVLGLPTSQTIPGSPAPSDIEIDPSGRFAYLILDAFDFVAAYDVDEATGALGSPILPTRPVGFDPNGLFVHPNGQFLYVTSADAITTFTIEGGSLATDPADVDATGEGPSHIAFSPGGDFAFVTLADLGLVRTYSVDANTGALEPLAPDATADAGAQAESVAVHPSGEWVFTAASQAQTTGGVTSFDLDPATGLLAIVDQHFDGLGPRDLVISPDGGHLYVANQFDGTISRYAIDAATGGLDLVGTAFAGTDTIDLVLTDSLQ